MDHLLSREKNVLFCLVLSELEEGELEGTLKTE